MHEWMALRTYEFVDYEAVIRAPPHLLEELFCFVSSTSSSSSSSFLFIF